MGNYLNIGNAGFQAIKKGLYIDKSGLISYINSTLGTMNKLTCISRPRRFGKSYATKMLCAYYDKSCNSKNLFADLAISKDPAFETHLNKYDVIYLDMTWFISNATDTIKNTVINMQQEVIKELHSVYPEAETGDTLPKMLSNVTEVTGNKFIIIIDEWDALFREAKEDTLLQKEYIQLMRSLFKSSLTDKMIEAAYITGILPIKKYGTQSALTDFDEYTMLQPEPLEEYVGFTENEVKNLCAESKISFSEIQNWYDGYLLGNDTHIYNPKSVLDAIKRNRLGSYWTQTETYESLKIYIDMNEDGLKEAIVRMLGGASCPIDIGTFQNDMTNIKCKDDVLTLLVHLGYLAYDVNHKTVFIPNEEVRQEFLRAVTAGKHSEAANMLYTSPKKDLTCQFCSSN